MTLTHLDLFSGIGGFSLAARWAGFETVGFCEIDKFCQKVLAKNFPGVPIHDDIRTLEFKNEIDIATASLPCQPFSQAGNKKGREDERYLWPSCLSVLMETRPSFIIIENVPAMVPMELDNIISDLQNEGYTTGQYIIPACAANAPHRRDRLWIIAYHYRIRGNFRQRDRQAGCIQEDIKRHVAQIQQKWTQLKPDAWETYTARDYLDYNTAASRDNDGLPDRFYKDRIKALGNSIVPQVAYPILACIRNIMGY